MNTWTPLVLSCFDEKMKTEKNGGRDWKGKSVKRTRDRESVTLLNDYIKEISGRTKKNYKNKTVYRSTSPLSLLSGAMNDSPVYLNVNTVSLSLLQRAVGDSLGNMNTEIKNSASFCMSLSLLSRAIDNSSSYSNMKKQRIALHGRYSYYWEPQVTVWAIQILKNVSFCSGSHSALI